MKKSTVCFRFLFAAAAALPAGCENDDGPAAAPSLEIHVADASAEEIVVEFRPGKGTDRYRYALGRPEDRESFELGQMRGVVTADADEPGKVVFDGLAAETDYMVYAQALNFAGGRGEAMAVAVSTTSGKALVGVEIIENTGKSLKVSFEPNRYAAEFRYALGTASDREDFEAGSMQGITAVKGQGRTEYEFTELIPTTEYVIFTRACCEDGVWADVAESPVTTVDAPWAYVEFTEFNSLQAVGTIRFSPVCTGANYFVCSEEMYLHYLTRGYGGDLDAMMREYEWDTPEERSFDLMNGAGDLMSGIPGESKLIIGAVFWTDDRRTAGYQIQEFTAPPCDPSLPLPGKPKVTVTPTVENPQILKITVRSDENTAALRLASVWTSRYEEIGDQGVRDLVDRQRFISPDQSYTHDARQLPIEENLLLYVEPCNGNGTMGGNLYRYEYSFSEGRIIE